MKIYHELAPYYDRFMSFIDYETEAEAIYSFLCQQQQAKGRILDIGAGSGGHLIPLLNKGVQVDGLDYAEEMLALLNAKIRREGFVSNLLHDDMRSFQTDAPYDVIYCFGETIHHLSDTAELTDFFHCAHQSLKAGGSLLFSWREKSYFTELTEYGEFYEHHGDDYLLWQAKVLENEAAAIAYTAFIKGEGKDDVYRRFRETHRLAVFDGEQILKAAQSAGFRPRPDLKSCFDDLLAEEPDKHITILEKVNEDGKFSQFIQK
ncbi:MAG TPA: class I SAM-dependent methyltransferase [Clostridiales bacterium]|nr:class I SAM-dependent methyltransferase [Clostridiales bacterium]